MVYTHSWQNCPIKLCFALMVFRSTKFDSPGSLAQLPSAPAYSTRAGASHPIHQRLPTRHEQEPAIRFTSAKKKESEKGSNIRSDARVFFRSPPPPSALASCNDSLLSFSPSLPPARRGLVSRALLRHRQEDQRSSTPLLSLLFSFLFCSCARSVAN
jgi:hypothetical protein